MDIQRTCNAKRSKPMQRHCEPNLDSTDVTDLSLIQFSTKKDLKQ